MSRTPNHRSRPTRGDRRPQRSGAPGALPDDPRAVALAERLRTVSLREEDRLRRRLGTLARERDAAALASALDDVEAATTAAEEKAAQRAASVPALHYPPELPVSQDKDRIAEALREHQVIVVAGETGSGKTTQLPKICLEVGRGLRGRIGHTQPRRIAARAVAERVAEELGTELGGGVGYAVRFTDTVGEDSLVKVMTDGILLAEIQRDPELLQYDTLIIDEAHERSLTIDFLLGYLAQLLPRRPGLKLVITSATIDPQRFSRHFGGAPVLEVSGRTYPVEVRYRPLLAEDLAESGEDDGEDGEGLVDEGSALREDDLDQTEGIVEAVRELAAEGPGDILVFLPGEREIRDTADALGDLVRERQFSVVGGGTEIVPLFARLSAEEQHRVFRPHPGRRIVLATNVAETSLTVPGIRYVIDAGTARISRYSHRTKVQRLPVERISQASANQRAGRCGRVADGVCIRLYSESDFASRPEFTDPEILRTNLAAVILQMTSLGLGDIAAFPFVEPPEQRAIADGLALLAELGALEPPRAQDRGVPRLTRTGRDLSRLPIDPKLGRMVLEAHRNGCLHEVLVVVAALSVQDPRERPLEQRDRAAQLHARFRHEQSDFLTFLNLWNYLQQLQSDLSSSAFRRRVKAELLHYLRIREWQDTYHQLRRVVRDLRMEVTVPDLGDPEEGQVVPTVALDADALHRSLLAGLLGNIGMKDVREDFKAAPRSGSRSAPRERQRGPQEYLGARGARFAVFPGSSLGRRNPDWVVAAELVETSRLWARVAAAVDPRWIEPLAEHVVKRNYSEPRWSRRRAAVVANERVTLYGVPVVANRPVAYGSIDAELSRELFIRHALVEGDFDTRHEFFHRNRELLEEAEELEHRARRRDIVVDDEVLFTFYDARIGADVVSGRHFDAWWKQVRREQPDLLTFDPAMLVADDAGVSEEQFPRSWRQGDLDLSLSYVFEPGSAQDGLTVDVPVEVVNRFDDRDLLWQVPGFRHDLVTALVRALPKALRRNLAPAPDKAAEFLTRVTPGAEDFWAAFEREMPLLGDGTDIYQEDVDLAKVPAHLRATYRVVAPDGTVLAHGKDFPALRASLEVEVTQTLTQAADELQRTGATGWLPDLPAEVPATHTSVRRGTEITSYPGLVDEGASVGLRTFATAAEATAAHRAGTLRLLALTLPAPTRAVQSRLPNDAKLLLTRAPHGSAAAVLADCLDATVADLLDAAGGPVRTAGEFEELRRTIAAGLEPALVQTVERTLRVLRTAAETERKISRTTSLALVPSLADVREQFTGLVHAGFVAQTGVDRLPDLLRYLAGIGRRLETMPENPQRDRVRLAEFARVRDEFANRVRRSGAVVPDGLAELRWSLEELRLQKFAPGVPTAGPVSDERVLKALAEF